MKQTAVEWLIDEMNNIKGSSTNMNGKVQFLEKELNNLFEQAKAMEKEQIENACDRFANSIDFTIEDSSGSNVPLLPTADLT